MSQSPEPAVRAASPADSLLALIEESRQLRADVRAKAETQRRTALVALAGVVVALLMLVAQLTILVQNRQRSNETRALIQDNSSTSQQIADCTTAGGKCYEEGTKRSAALIGGLLAAVEEIAVCNKASDTAAEARACSDRALAKLAAQAGPPVPAGSGTADPRASKPAAK